MTILEINHAVADRHRIFQYIYSQWKVREPHRHEWFGPGFATVCTA
jgi:hypothetical protein